MSPPSPARAGTRPPRRSATHRRSGCRSAGSGTATGSRSAAGTGSGVARRQDRPRPTVHDDAVAEELGVPDRRDVAVGDERSTEAVEERPGVRIEERAVAVERPVLDRERDLVVLRSRGSPSCGAGPGRTAGPPVPATVGLSAGSSLRMMKNPAGPAYTLRRVMPRVWSWYQAVDGRCVFGYRNVASARDPTSARRAPLWRGRSRTTSPRSRNPAGMLVASGRNQASA